MYLVVLRHVFRKNPHVTVGSESELELEKGKPQNRLKKFEKVAKTLRHGQVTVAAARLQ